MDERLRNAVRVIKGLSSLRNPPYELPADSFLERAAAEIINGWQPIDTAPRDGTEIIVCQAGTGNVEFVRFYADGEAAWLDRTCDEFFHPTHWMPIPESPP